MRRSIDGYSPGYMNSLAPVRTGMGGVKKEADRTIELGGKQKASGKWIPRSLLSRA